MNTNINISWKKEKKNIIYIVRVSWMQIFYPRNLKYLLFVAPRVFEDIKRKKKRNKEENCYVSTVQGQLMYVKIVYIVITVVSKETKENTQTHKCQDV